MTTQVTAPEMEVLAEAMRIVRGKTIMLPTRKHLKALAELNKELLNALKAVNPLLPEDVQQKVEKLTSKAEGRTL